MTAYDSSDSPQSERDSFRHRLAAYSRYVALVKAQEEAVEDGDLDRFAELGQARQEIQEEIGEDPFDPDFGVDPTDGDARALLEGALAALRSAQARDDRIHQALSRLRTERAGNIRTMSTRRGQVSSYLAGQEHPSSRPPSRVNRKG